MQIISRYLKSGYFDARRHRKRPKLFVTAGGGGTVYLIVGRIARIIRTAGLKIILCLVHGGFEKYSGWLRRRERTESFFAVV